MSKLAIDGGKPAVTQPLKPFNTIGYEEAKAAYDTVRYFPLSGYLGGNKTGGYHVERLERAWEETFRVKHAVSCNSATSGLLLACIAGGVGPDSVVVTTPASMSATAAAPAFLGAKVRFDDIEADTFSLGEGDIKNVVITTNLFGHPARPVESAFLIEDNAHAIFAKDGDRFSGTIGNIGVFSSNVHKHCSSGEGGVCVTNYDGCAERLRLARNHSEMAGMGPGLNLRMTEVTAAILYQQLLKGPQIVSERVEIAESLIDMSKDWPGMLIPPTTREGCSHSFYMVAWKSTLDRKRFVQAMQSEGVPFREGYVEPLYRLPAFKGCGLPAHCPIAETMHYASMITYENCAVTPTKKQLRQFREAFRKVCDHASRW